MSDLKLGDTGVLRTEHGEVRWRVTTAYSSGVVVVAWDGCWPPGYTVPTDSPLYSLLVPEPPARKDSQGRPIEEQYAYLTGFGPHRGSRLLACQDEYFEAAAPCARLLTDGQAKSLYGCTCTPSVDQRRHHICVNRDPSCPTHGENT